MKFNTMISAVLQKNQSQTWKCYQQHKYMNRSDEDINVQFASLNLTTSLSVSSDLYRIKEKSHFLVDVIILFCFLYLLVLKCVFWWFLSGISTLAKSPAEASDYLHPLLSFAAAHVPQNKHKETPLYILCTAGMRLLPDR